MLIFDKTEVKNLLIIDNIYQLLEEWGAEPIYTDFGILSTTICHNEPGEGSRKLYYYQNSGLFQCFTNCGSYDIFELVRKVMSIQKHINMDLNDAIRWISAKFGYSGKYEEASDQTLKDWSHLANYERVQSIEVSKSEATLKEYDVDILAHFNYNVIIEPWLNEDISLEIMRKNLIGYYPGGDQITIPHFDKDGRFIGLRGRTLCAETAELYGKYMPIRVGKVMYNHPLGFNLYNLNNTKNNIAQMRKAVVFESEKSCLKTATAVGFDNDISVACCGSNLTAFQVQLLLEAGAQEIIIAFDKQYQALNTDESKKWIEKLTKINNKYKNEVLISFLWDKDDLLQYKNSPIDEGIDKFNYLFRNRIIL